MEWSGVEVVKFITFMRLGHLEKIGEFNKEHLQEWRDCSWCKQKTPYQMGRVLQYLRKGWDKIMRGIENGRMECMYGQKQVESSVVATLLEGV